MNNILPKVSLSLFLLLIGSFIGCSNLSTPIASRWTDSSIVIDGKINDWVTATTYDQRAKISYGFQNDSDYLYILFRPTKKMLRQAMMFGFTIWFDAEGENKKRLGIRFPIGMMNYTHGNLSPMEMMGGEFSDIMKQRLSEMLHEFDILYPEEDDKFRFSKYLRNGIDIALNDSLEEAVYEMKIPFRKIEPHDVPYNISSLSSPICIGFELGIFDHSKVREEIPDRPEGGTPPGGMGRESRRGGGRFPVGGMARQNIILDAWFFVQLASSITFSKIIDQ